MLAKKKGKKKGKKKTRKKEGFRPPVSRGLRGCYIPSPPEALAVAAPNAGACRNRRIM
jgi:hypothetical protein